MYEVTNYVVQKIQNPKQLALRRKRYMGRTDG
jgi:hypothetical protein